ncbi:MAG TPA: winged helix-turn-helix domain-containing protein [Microlunatus sp.]
MLFTAATLDGLVDGSVTATYRRWTTVRPKVGSRFTTRVGMVEVAGISPVGVEELSDADAAAAGFADRAALLRWLDRSARGPGDTRRAGEDTLYRIDLALAGPDPRVALRADDALDPTALADLGRRLDRMDGAAEAPWTRSVLRQVADQPGVVSTVLAEAVGLDRPTFKIRVRRLKALGLTESLEIGYRLAPRGRAFLAADSS